MKSVNDVDILCNAGEFHMDRDMRVYQRGDQFGYDSRPQHSHITEYRPPPTRNQSGVHGGMLGLNRGFGRPESYENAGLGGAGSDYDINLLMNISKVL